ncbi:serine acetyltransferase [Aliivibrio finisterrensis]|uniref:serine acetyltransferase n=1 Tax=Aliivibrio finisterrensis TaxID=511998 RepID=UPI00102006B7|nr:serine acetyltransferase [Aliivibrio finisterrensis]RYU67847.1 serine acetyltransferase [Aliivibrio finisterrensis]RYU71506.1 serine acetyltransferase [Aliivibrio finisterrensis]RYU74668.1 serine acetyltransferase [Aliivibrio finisterrensis]
MISLIIKWLFTSNPIKKFRAELDLMFWGTSHCKIIRKYFQRRIFYVYNCDISHVAEIHPSVMFPHPCGIVIGSKAKVKEDCRIYQQVTIGSTFNSDNSMAEIGKNTYVGTGAKIIGGINIGESCYIGANAVVTKHVPDKCTVVGFNRFVNLK